MEEKFYSGFVSIIGRPNVGKSTLLNLLTGEKVAITSDKPQTTRNKIRSIVTKDNYQIIFIDTPGMNKALNKLGEYMGRSADSALDGADIILFLVEPDKKVGYGDMAVIEKLKFVRAPVFLVINKIDTVEKSGLLGVIDRLRALYEFDKIIPVSAATGENTDSLIKDIVSVLPEGPMYFPDDMITDQPERQICAEIIREKLLRILEDEIPHGIAVEIISFKNIKGPGMIGIEATVYCEKESHKGIIIGKGGAVLKKAGTNARLDIEKLLGVRVNLKLWVKIKKGWRDNDFLLKNFGYSVRDL